MIIDWKETVLNEQQGRRLKQIMEYNRRVGFDESGDQYLAYKLAEYLDLMEWVEKKRLKNMSRWEKWLRGRIEKSNSCPYSCNLLRRCDFVLYAIWGRKPIWSDEGRLLSGNFELPTLFPDWMYTKAAHAQNRWPWTRLILSA
ncbi:MAG: hypothetical protein V3R81_11015 [Gammaproteobacteria bacterium]